MAAGTYNLTGSNALERGACYSYSVDLSTSTGEYSLSGYSVSGYCDENGTALLAQIGQPQF